MLNAISTRNGSCFLARSVPFRGDHCVAKQTRGREMSPLVFPRIAWRALQAWFNNGDARHGAAIAYYTLFAMAPVLLVVIGLAGLLFGQEAVRGEIVGQIAGLIGRDAATAVQEILRRASEPREGIGATVFGVVGLLIATTGAFVELQTALNTIWNVKVDTDGIAEDLKALALRRVRSLGVVVSIGFLLVVSLTVNSAVHALVNWLSVGRAVLPVVIALLNELLSLTVTAALFAILFRVLPDVHLGRKDVLTGAVVTAILFAGGQRLIGFYLGQSNIASPFGAAGTVAVILVWVYYSAQIFLYGAEFTRAYSAHKGRLPAPMQGAKETQTAIDEVPATNEL